MANVPKQHFFFNLLLSVHIPAVRSPDVLWNAVFCSPAHPVIKLLLRD